MTAKHKPDFIVLGQGKAGTSLMYRVLSKNPAIGVSHPKELHFFSSRYSKGLDWYWSHFDQVPETAKRIGDISPSYLRPESVDRIHDTFGSDFQIVFILRRPIDQTYSRYLQNICARERPMAYDSILADLPNRLDRQFETIRQCYDLFGPDNILPLFFETDIQTFAFEAKLMSFLGLPASDYSKPFREGRMVNSGVMPRYLYGGEDGLEIQENGDTYWIPPRQLAFCAQTRNSRVAHNVSPKEAAKAFARQDHWTTEVTPDQYARAQQDAVLPAADRREAEANKE